MIELNWISQEAHRIHDLFQAVFYVLVTVLLLLGVLIEYFKLPIGGTPSFGTLVGRVLIAAVLLHIYPDVANLISDLTSGLSKQLGDLNEFKVVLNKMGDKLDQLTWSWTSVRQSLIILVSYLSFFLLYFSIHVAQAIYLYASVLLFIFSPILIALYVLPQTAAATSGLFRSLIEVSLWKPVWCVIATLIWSSGLSSIQGEGTNLSFLSAVCFCLIAAASLIMTPTIIHALASGGLSSMASTLGGISIPGVGSVTAAGSLAKSALVGKKTYNAGLSAADFVTRHTSPRINELVHKIPPIRTASSPPFFGKWKTEAVKSNPNLASKANSKERKKA